MQKISDYLVVWASNADEMGSKIRNLINDGWQPIGGIFAVKAVDNLIYFAQAVVKYSN